MKKFVLIIGICLQIVPALCFGQDWQQKTLLDCDSCTVLTPSEVRKTNRIYDDRTECYQQYIAAVRLAERWEQNYNIKVRQLDKLGEELLTRQQVQNLTDTEYQELQENVRKLQKALNRNKTLIWILAGYGAATTVVAAVFIGVN
jgi:hypothetical protein